MKSKGKPINIAIINTHRHWFYVFGIMKMWQQTCAFGKLLNYYWLCMMVLLYIKLHNYKYTLPLKWSVTLLNLKWWNNRTTKLLIKYGPKLSQCMCHQNMYVFISLLHSSCRRVPFPYQIVLYFPFKCIY